MQHNYLTVCHHTYPSGNYRDHGHGRLGHNLWDDHTPDHDSHRNVHHDHWLLGGCHHSHENNDCHMAWGHMDAQLKSED